MSQLKVLVVGASIAGPMAAYWFAKAGAKVTVIERFPHLRTNGQNVDIRTVGVTVMRKIPGMEEAVRTKTTPLEGMAFVRADGRPYGILRPTGNPDQQSLVSEYEILRGDLAQILFDLTKSNENIDYVFGEQIVAIQQDGQCNGPVTVEFSNGFPTTDFDLVVACDGATSRTRAMGLGCGIRDYVVSQNSWAAYFSIPQDLLAGSKTGAAYSAVGGRFIGVGPGPSGMNQVTLMHILPRNNRDETLAFREAKKRGDDSLKEFIAQLYTGAGWKCDEVVKSMMGAGDFYASELVQVKVPSLYKGRFVLVGDAGYAGSPGSGTSLAMAGAYVLAGEVCKHRGSLEAALFGYEKTMRPLIDDMQKMPPLIPTMMAPQTSWGVWLRNMIFAFVCWTRIIEFSQRFFAASFSNSDDYFLPEYEWMA
ncbi:hypothetical protein Plec18167_000668 [Paecilomyces lecythidis]|uniref:FAD-binding domain-containing protein n=1 Tax=Paecilomyces lecythidis TaxID=3004212 RepID=A0ABR3YEL6_9EURO